MYNRSELLLNILNICEVLAFVVALFKYKTIAKTPWKWFMLYLCYIVFFEFFTRTLLSDNTSLSNKIVNYFQIPIEYLFLYWLYAINSLKREKLFLTITFVFLCSHIVEFLFPSKQYVLFSISLTTGSLLLLILVLLEFIKQIKSDSILQFYQNKMFYINLGVILFYIGNAPFLAWYSIVLEFPDIWNLYQKYYLISGSAMYLLFAASFIWGKQNS